jgi:hypothetical protein
VVEWWSGGVVEWWSRGVVEWGSRGAFDSLASGLLAGRNRKPMLPLGNLLVADLPDFYQLAKRAGDFKVDLGWETALHFREPANSGAVSRSLWTVVRFEPGTPDG